ncbi:F-box/RNI-like/FBD-like domains-containing protein [Rhynchospora pubera]|uniref:F-box/RNI-like/FBD-like domains-containing protein n=1 Tax=Rhynchospora pubera TaxID=906938 RepID=A0AAV8FRX1_9POAL|nr:F-box/RNI-like/FBD-like domains-containing protein [Rhynchospora pubera]
MRKEIIIREKEHLGGRTERITTPQKERLKEKGTRQTLPPPPYSIFLHCAHSPTPPPVRCLPKLQKGLCSKWEWKMEPPNKHTRSNEELTISHSFPDLSSLPEPVLVHILSYMDPKEAVQTCILSKRWRRLWTLIPSLNLTNSRFKGNDAAFVHFVTSMLYFRGASKLDSFSLHFNASQHVADEELCQIHVGVATSWIYSVLSCKPLVISLELHKLPYLKLPHALFTCASLEQLEGILSGCPLLEELSLIHCILEFSEMKSDLLSCLSITSCRGSKVVEIFMPSLISLHLTNQCPEIIKLSLKNTPSLVKVFVFYSHYAVSHFSGALEFFKCLTAVPVIDLEFCGSGVKDLLEIIIPNCPIFHNLKQLSFGEWGTNEKLDVLFQLLQHTPNLEKLTIVHKKVECSRRAKQKVATIEIPFRCEKLKVIEVKYSDPSGVHELIDVFLRNTSHGKRLRIDYSRS